MTGRTRGLMAFHRARTLIDQLPEDGSMDFYASLMLALPVPASPCSAAAAWTAPPRADMGTADISA